MVKYFQNKNTDEEIRWDAAIYRTHTELMIGRGGKNHWHRINPESDLDKKYLSRKDKPCSILSDESFIPPENQELKEDHLIAIEQDEKSLNQSIKSVVQVLDSKTENWLHDAIVNSIVDSNQISVEISHSRGGHIIESYFDFKDAEFLGHSDPMAINGSEIYMVKVWSLTESKGRLNFILADNSEFQIDFESFKYAEKKKT
ncbi:MAG: hypothetical protein ACI8ZM_001283 [Crocinitomix sp.]|jgi:hypothetical protein